MRSFTCDNDEEECGVKVPVGAIRELFPSVFFNPLQAVNRELSTLCVRLWVRKNRELFSEMPGGKIRILDLLAGCGVRGIRHSLALSADGVPVECSACDAEAEACRAAELLARRVLGNCQTFRCAHEQASVFAAAHAHQFHVVDVDPCGSAAPFLEAAMTAIRAPGLLLVNAFDVRALTGQGDKRNCAGELNAYGTVLPQQLDRACAGRVLLGAISRQAAVYDFSIVPLLVTAVDGFHIRAIVEVKAAVRSTQGLSRVAQSCAGFVSVCSSCNAMQELSSSCHICDCTTTLLGGPLWPHEQSSDEFLKELSVEGKSHCSARCLDLLLHAKRVHARNRTLAAAGSAPVVQRPQSNTLQVGEKACARYAGLRKYIRLGMRTMTLRAFVGDRNDLDGEQATQALGQSADPVARTVAKSRGSADVLENSCGQKRAFSSVAPHAHDNESLVSMQSMNHRCGCISSFFTDGGGSCASVLQQYGIEHRPGARLLSLGARLDMALQGPCGSWARVGRAFAELAQICSEECFARTTAMTTNDIRAMFSHCCPKAEFVPIGGQRSERLSVRKGCTVFFPGSSEAVLRQGIEVRGNGIAIFVGLQVFGDSKTPAAVALEDAAVLFLSCALRGGEPSCVSAVDRARVRLLGCRVHSPSGRSLFAAGRAQVQVEACAVGPSGATGIEVRGAANVSLRSSAVVGAGRSAVSAREHASVVAALCLVADARRCCLDVTGPATGTVGHCALAHADTCCIAAQRAGALVVADSCFLGRGTESVVRSRGKGALVELRRVRLDPAARQLPIDTPFGGQCSSEQEDTDVKG